MVVGILSCPFVTIAGSPTIIIRKEIAARIELEPQQPNPRPLPLREGENIERGDGWWREHRSSRIDRERGRTGH